MIQIKQNNIELELKYIQLIRRMFFIVHGGPPYVNHFWVDFCQASTCLEYRPTPGCGVSLEWTLFEHPSYSSIPG